MTVVVVCDVLGEENNGTTVAAMNLVRALKKRGHEVRVVCSDEFRKGEPGYYIVPQMNFGVLNGYVRKNGVSAAKTDKRILKKALTGADAVHIITPFFLGCAAAKMAVEMGLPVTAGFHCQAENFSNHIFLMNSRRFNRAVYKFFYKHLYRYVDCVHYPSQFIRDTFESQCGHKTEGRVISNGVNTRFVPGRCNKPRELQDKFVILFTGRYSREKSHTVLIQAAARSKHADRIQLVFAGQGPQEAKIKKQAEKLLKTKPIYRFFSREELVEVLHYSDLYVHPAEIEIEAIACLEAISCGLVPVISDSPRSATKYFALDEKNLFKCNDPADLAAKIDYWLDNPEEKLRRAEEYRGFSERFAQERCMDEMEKMICETAEKKYVAG